MSQDTKFLSYTGLAHYDEKIKEYIIKAANSYLRLVHLELYNTLSTESVTYVIRYQSLNDIEEISQTLSPGSGRNIDCSIDVCSQISIQVRTDSGYSASMTSSAPYINLSSSSIGPGELFITNFTGLFLDGGTITLGSSIAG